MAFTQNVRFYPHLSNRKFLLKCPRWSNLILWDSETFRGKVEWSLTTSRTFFTIQLVRANNVFWITFPAIGDGGSTVYLEFIATWQAEVGDVITNTPRKILMIRMVCVMFQTFWVNVVRVAIRPCFYSFITLITDEGSWFCHFLVPLETSLFLYYHVVYKMLNRVLRSIAL